MTESKTQEVFRDFQKRVAEIERANCRCALVQGPCSTHKSLADMARLQGYHCEIQTEDGKPKVVILDLVSLRAEDTGNVALHALLLNRAKKEIDAHVWASIWKRNVVVSTLMFLFLLNLSVAGFSVSSYYRLIEEDGRLERNAWHRDQITKDLEDRIERLETTPDGYRAGIHSPQASDQSSN